VRGDRPNPAALQAVRPAIRSLVQRRAPPSFPLLVLLSVPPLLPPWPPHSIRLSFLRPFSPLVLHLMLGFLTWVHLALLVEVVSELPSSAS